MPRVPIASGGARPECRPSTLDTPPRAAARRPDGCGATARNTSLVRPTATSLLTTSESPSPASLTSVRWPDSNAQAAASGVP